jgi:hypothetical protein
MDSDMLNDSTNRTNTDVETKWPSWVLVHGWEFVFVSYLLKVCGSTDLCNRGGHRVPVKARRQSKCDHQFISLSR